MAETDSLKGLPRRIHVGHFTFRVTVAPRTHEMLTEAYGRADLEGLRIYLRDDMPLATALNTVQHEITHCINYVYDVSDESTEEQFTSRHTTGLVDVWMRNPRLYAWQTRMLRAIKKENSHD